MIKEFKTHLAISLFSILPEPVQSITDIECRIVNLEDHSGSHYSKKICEDVPTEKCVPVPVKIEGQKCVNIPTQVSQYFRQEIINNFQSCETVPVTANKPVPKKQCFKKPRKVCQTLLSTKPKVVTAKVPREVCDHRAGHSGHQSSKPKPIRPSQKIPTQKTSESGLVEQVRSPRLPMSEALNPHNKLEDLYAAEYQIDRYRYSGDTGDSDTPELREEEMMIADSDNIQQFYEHV